MEVQHPKVVLTARDADGAVVQRLELTPYEWYEDGCSLIDSGEKRRSLAIRTIEGYQTDGGGKRVQEWKNVYDADGRLHDSEVLLDDWKPTLPSPPPGQSAGDQLRRLGIFPPTRSSGADGGRAGPGDRPLTRGEQGALPGFEEVVDAPDDRPV